jgi:hypothetical protein
MRMFSVSNHRSTALLTSFLILSLLISPRIMSAAPTPADCWDAYQADLQQSWGDYIDDLALDLETAQQLYDNAFSNYVLLSLSCNLDPVCLALALLNYQLVCDAIAAEQAAEDNAALVDYQAAVIGDTMTYLACLAATISS